MTTTILTYFDHLGYLFTGALSLVGVRLLTGWPGGALPTDLVPIALWTITAYLAGHAIAFVASMILERVLVAKLLGYPTTHLFATASPRLAWSALVRLAPLSAAFRNDLRTAQAALFGTSFSELSSSDQFILQHHYVYRHDPVSAQRLLTFISEYDLMRNTSALGIILAVIAGAQARWATATVLLGAALLFFLRYYKFLHLFATELLFAIRILGNPPHRILTPTRASAKGDCDTVD